MARTDPGFALRMPADLKEWVREEAYRARRSINGHLVHLIEKARQETEARPGTGGQPAAGEASQA